jgi:hypothetical protein
MHALAGRTVVLQVVPPAPGVKVEIVAEPPLHTIVPTTCISTGTVPTYHCELSGRLTLRLIPVPATGKLHVTTLDGLPDPCRITVPITVWPSYWTLMVWWLLAYLAVLGLRLQRTAAEGHSFEEVLRTLWKDSPYLLTLLAGSLLVLIPLWFLGWLLSLADPAAGND